MNMTQLTTRTRSSDRAAFTLVELLVVMFVIILLVTLLIVAVSAATSQAREAKTTALMNTISQACSTFKRDHGYLPPVLNLNRDASPEPTFTNFGDNTFVDGLQGWNSLTSLAEYLLGYGPASEDGFGDLTQTTLGLRDPGRRGYWGAPTGLFVDRDPSFKGKVYGPYMEVDESDLLGAIDPSDPDRVFLPHEAGFQDNPDYPRVLLDYWENPIVYYRDHPHPDVTLAEVIALRPFQIDDGEAAPSPVADKSQNGDSAATVALRSAPFGLLSAGPDKKLNMWLRYDDPEDSGQGYNGSAVTDLVNQDNLVEVGQ